MDSNDFTQTLEAGLQQFRREFLAALDRHQLDQCQALLDKLERMTQRLRHAHRYHQAVLLYEQRQYDQAEVILRVLLAEKLDDDRRAAALLELAILLDEQGEWKEAEHYYQEALTAYKMIQDPLGQAKVYNNLGICICFQVEQGVGDPARLTKAIVYHQQAITLAQVAGDPHEVAKNRHGLGKVYGAQKEYDQALAAFQTYLQDLGQHDHARGYTLTDIAALVHLPQGQWNAAALALNEAVAILQNFKDDLNLAEALTHRGNLFARQNQITEALADYDAALRHAESIRIRLTAPTARTGYRTTTEFIYTAPITLHLRHGQMKDAFTAAERARSRVLADLLAGQAAQSHADIPNDLLQRRDGLRPLLDLAYAAEEPPANLSELEAELADLDRQIELLDPAYAGLTAVASLSTDEVQARLPTNAALLTFVGDSDNRLWTLVVTKNDIQGVVIPKLSVRWLQNYLADHLDGDRQGKLVPHPQTGQLAQLPLFPDLYQTLIAPVEKLLDSAETIYIVPYGPLYYLPLGALTPDLAYLPPLLAAPRRVVYAPSATVLFNYCHTCTPSPYHNWLAIAPSDPHLQFIQGAAQQLVQPGAGSTLLGDAATRQAFLQQAGHYRVIYFLGHGFFDHRYPMLSRLQLEDGSLRASEILRELRLQADLVVLAACETGRGQILRGDEILGLSRALLYAGTPSLLVTLWKVHEIPTRLLLEKFTAELSLAGSTPASFDPARALASAQNWLRTLSYATARDIMSKWDEITALKIDEHLTVLWQMTHPGTTPQADSQLFDHPFFWSPYILIGDRPPVQSA